jgi:hypothetical protein
MRELRVDIGGSNRGFQIATDETKRIARDLGHHLNSTLGGSIGGLTSGFISEEAMRQTFEYGSEVSNLAKRLGISTDAVQRWGYALKQSGSDMSALGPFFGKLGSARDAALAGTKKTIDSFKALGVTIDDLKSKRLEDIGMIIAKTFEAGDAQKLIGAFRDVGGRGAVEMVSAFKSGFSDLTKEADDLGIVIDKKVIEKLAAGGERFKSLAMQMRSAFAPFFAWFGDQIQNILDALNIATAQVADLTYGNTNGETVKSVVDAIVARKRKEEIPRADKPTGDLDVEDETAKKSEKKSDDERIKLEKDYNTELERSADLKERLAMLQKDEVDLFAEWDKAADEDDYNRELKAGIELLRTQREIKDTQKQISNPALHRAASEHIDSTSRTFQSWNAVMNPTLEIGREQLGELKGIRQGIHTLNSKKDIFAK